MQVTIVPAGTKTAAATIRALLDSESKALKIRGVYRNLAKVPPDFGSSSEFEAVQGDVADASSLDLAGSDAVLAVTPPIFAGTDIVAHAKVMSENVKKAVENARTVRKFVLLSSIGAHMEHGVGEIKTNNIAETVFANMAGPEMVFIRCAYFMENWTAALDSLKSPEPFIYSTITPLDWKVPMVAVQDIGLTLAAELTSISATRQSEKPTIVELQGPQDYSALDVGQAFTAAVGKDVRVQRVEKHELHAFFSRIFPEAIVGEWVEMTTSFLPGGILADYGRDVTQRNVRHGRTDLKDVISRAVKGMETPPCI